MFGRKPPTNSLAMKEKTLSGVPFGNDSLSLCLSNPHSSPNLPQPWTPAFMDGAKKLCKWMNPSYEPSWASPETQLFLSATSSGQLVVEKLWNRGHLRKSTFSGLFFFITVINLFFTVKSWGRGGGLESIICWCLFCANRFTHIILFNLCHSLMRGFPGSSVIKNLPPNAGDAEDSGSIPGSGSSPGGGNGNHSSILAWEIPWTEKPGKP